MSAPILKKKYISVLITFLLLSVSAAMLLDALIRPLWFDEALTIINFLFPPSIIHIYTNYSIPNNHIAYTFFLRIWIETSSRLFPLTDISFRSFSTASALLAVFFMFKFWRRSFGLWAAALTSLSFAVSMQFAIYGTAIRGYMLSCLFVVFGLETALRWRQSGLYRWVFAYFLSALLAVAIMPSNILAFAAICLILSSSLKRDSLFSIKTVLPVILPVLAFGIFYLPIWTKTMNVLYLKEGWSSWTSASLHLYGAFVFSFLPVMLFSSKGLFLKFRKNLSVMRIILISTVFILPALCMFIKTPAPFPRVFFPLWPIWFYLFASLMKTTFAYFRKYREKQLSVISPAFLGVLLLWGICQGKISGNLSKIFTPEGAQDDFFRPYFLYDFHPDQVVEETLELAQSPGEVFIDQSADWPSIIYYGKSIRRGGIDADFWLFDYPYRKIRSLGNIKRIFIIAHGESDMECLKARFPIRDYELIRDLGFQKIYKAFLK